MSTYRTLRRVAFVPVRVVVCLVARAMTGTPLVITGKLKKWHKVTLISNGPSCEESDTPDPFLYHHVNVTFTKGTKTYVVPDYFASDGDAANSEAVSGNKWRVHFCPNETGT